ncbi:MAG: type IX secretion system sortase PorU [Muribaculaceae bacterium]|nr:type IX secretion system sortase PorU [Muribaculaceae bacterium]
MNKIFSHILKSLPIFGILCSSSPTQALEPSHYASNSVLSDGQWTRITVEKSGAQFIPVASLQAMGFSDISKVNVYGIGGWMLPEYINTSTSDDLPLLPVVRTPKGIYFFGTDNISWSRGNNTPYTHTINPYDTKSYYYISDRPADAHEMQAVAAPSSADGAISTFTDRLLHESELAGIGESGRNLFGESFLNNRTQTFSFSLPDLKGETVIMKYRFGAKATPQSSIMVSANGERLPSTGDDIVRECANNQEFIRTATAIKTIPNADEKLNIQFSFSNTGVATIARLDYIELFYERRLRLKDGQLYFYTSSDMDGKATIEGCTADTRIWDVTVPWNPVEMKTMVNGSSATITLPKGYHEYIAFTPDQVAQRPVSGEKVANQNIHAMEVPDMLIISYDEYMEGARRIARLHEEMDGMKVAVLRPEDIYNEFSGGLADVTAFKRLLKMWYDRKGADGIRYCLLMGRPYYDNRSLSPDAQALSYRPLPIWQEPNSFTDTGSYSTDCYIAWLEDSEPGYSFSSAKMQVGVGRLPVKSSQEALEMAAKIEKYVKNPNYGAWRNKMMILADGIDDESQADIKPDKANPRTFFDQSQNIYELLKTTPGGEKYIYDRVFLDAHKLEYTSVGRTYPTARTKMLANFNDAVYINYLGHASPRNWSHENLFTWTDINSMSNRNLPILFGGTCEFAKWDANAVSGGELLVLNPNAGVIAMVIASRTVYITQNYQLNKALAPNLLLANEWGETPRLGDFFRRGMNRLVDSNKLRYCLIGDPALKFPQPTSLVEIESINGSNPKEEGTVPEVKALGKVELSGKIVDSSGEKDETFNGLLDLVLLDAEKVVETKDTGKGLDRTYNDRTSRLTSTTVRIENGSWKATLMLPSEIENNYSPAMISAYAWNQNTGREAHGISEDLYVYGYPEDMEIDAKAPEIEEFYLNSPSFKSGGVVSPNPVVFATLSDESGLNLSNSGIGHNMLLSLDGKKFYNDLSLYFSSDPSRPGAGMIAYPLEDIEPGKHTLELTVYDNANNSASAILEFNVGVAIDPAITDLGTNVNPASTSVVFNIHVDRANSALDCMIEVFDLMGRTVWTKSQKVNTDMDAVINADWDLRDKGGVRVPRGIYLYRATVRTPEGTYTSKSKKLAVTAQ